MPAIITHIFSSLKSDGPHSDLLQPSHWNANHILLLEDSLGGLWELVVDTQGNLSTTAHSSPGTSYRIPVDENNDFFVDENLDFFSQGAV